MYDSDEMKRSLVLYASPMRFMMDKGDVVYAVEKLINFILLVVAKKIFFLVLGVMSLLYVIVQYCVYVICSLSIVVCYCCMYVCMFCWLAGNCEALPESE